MKIMEDEKQIFPFFFFFFLVHLVAYIMGYKIICRESKMLYIFPSFPCSFV